MRTGWFACLAAGLVGAGTNPAPAASPSDRAHVARTAGVPSDCDGVIAEITIHYDNVMTDELAPLYRDLFESLGPGVKVRVLCASHDAADEFRERWGAAAARGGRDVALINVDRPITMWARDRYIARQPLDLRGRASGFVTAPLPDYEYFQLNELEIQSELQQSRLNPSLLDLPVQLEGGNVVANGRSVFAGMNVIAENGGALHGPEIEKDLRAIFGRDFILLGDDNGEVPWCHVDMYLTPIDDHTVLIASADLGAEFLGLSCGDEDWDDGRRPLFDVACPSDLFQRQLDRIAQRAEEEGYDVLRMPAVISPHEGWMITYNNVLMEERGDCKTVYLPVYDQPVLDDVAAEIYRRLGFTVHTVDVSGVFTLGGALRCIVNVTERRDLPGVPNTYVSRRTRGRLRYIDLPSRATFPAGRPLRSQLMTPFRRARAA